MYREEDFIKFLTYLAAQEGRTLDEFTIQLYDDELSPFGYTAVCQALRNYAVSAERVRLPSIAEIKKILSPTLSSEIDANLITGRIFESISRFGYMNSREAMQYIGDHGWTAVCQFGGWVYICENSGTKAMPNSSLRAQIRDLVKAILEQNKTFLPPSAEDLKLEGNGKFKELVEGLNQNDLNKSLASEPE